MMMPRKALPAEPLRRLAVRMALDGQLPDEVANLLQVSERSVWRWMGAWRGGGDAALATKPGQGRPAKLTESQAGSVLGWLEQSPCDWGFATERWTAPRVAALIEQSFGVRMNHRYLNHWLRRRGISPQVPVRRPRERDEGVIGGWVARQWPVIKKK